MRKETVSLNPKEQLHTLPEEIRKRLVALVQGQFARNLGVGNLLKLP